MRRSLVTPRWLAVHVAAFLLAGTFCGLGWWQWDRGREGNFRSFGYAFEWPLFAAFVLFMWGRFVYLEVRGPGDRATGGAEAVPDRDRDPEAAAPAGHAAHAAPAELPRVLSRGVAARRSAAPVEEEPDEELDAYNRYLADLNARADRAREHRGET